MRLSAVLLLSLMLWAPLAAEGRPDLPVLKDACAMLRVADAQWVDRQVAQFAAACGEDPTPARERMARSLFCSASTVGVDMQRPSLLAWRPGRAPLVAIVPIANRRAFVENFGVMPAGEPPLVRVADREGTVVYSQNSPAGRDEYRLLISDNTAYLARTLDECRQLASHPPSLADDYAVGFSAWGPFTDSLPLGVSLDLPSVASVLPSPALRTIVTALIEQGRASLPAQITGLGWQLKAAPNGAAVWTASVQAAPESALAEWLRAQANQGGRLGAALPEDAPLRMQGQFAWQGQCDALGHQLEPGVKARTGAAWTPAADEAWNAAWSLLDHAGGFALGLRPQGQGAMIGVIEHPQAELLAAQLAAVDAALDGRTAEKDAAISGWRLSGGAGSAAITVADRQAVVAVSPDALAADRAQAMVSRLTTSAPTGGVPALLVASLDGTRLVQLLFEERLEPETPLPRVVIDLAIKVGHDELQAQCDLPLAEAAALLTKVNWKN